MIINFFKMQSTGNDFVMIDLSQNPNADVNAEFVKKISDRHFGIGCDLVVFYNIHAETSVIDVRFFNSDGSEAKFCGNAARCVGLLVEKTKKISKCKMRVVSDNEAPTYNIQTHRDGSISYDIKKCCSIKCIDPETVLEIEKSVISALGIYNVSHMDVGNPHLVLFMKNSPTLKLIEEVGFFLSAHPIFPEKTNVGFAKVLSGNELELTVFERGAGLTLSCGSGAYAAVCAALENKFLKYKQGSPLTVYQRGGDMQVEFRQDGYAVQSGSASMVFSGKVEIKNEAEIKVETTIQNNIFDDDGSVLIYTDGACSGNPGPGGWGAVIIANGKISEISGSESDTTNNRMELMAAIKALENVPTNNKISLYTDSQYVKNGITKWISNWVKNGWKNSENKPVKNQDLWQKLLEVSGQRKISWHWVKGHDENEYNNLADSIARAQCKSI